MHSCMLNVHNRMHSVCIFRNQKIDPHLLNILLVMNILSLLCWNIIANSMHTMLHYDDHGPNLPSMARILSKTMSNASNVTHINGVRDCFVIKRRTKMTNEEFFLGWSKDSFVLSNCHLNEQKSQFEGNTTLLASRLQIVIDTPIKRTLKKNTTVNINNILKITNIKTTK